MTKTIEVSDETFKRLENEKKSFKWLKTWDDVIQELFDGQERGPP